MSRTKALFPGWFFGPGGAQKLCETEADVPKGWTDNQAEAIAADEKAGKREAAKQVSKPAAAKPAKAPAAEKPASELGAARADYKAKFGKNPSPKWDVAAIREKLAASEQQHDL